MLAIISQLLLVIALTGCGNAVSNWTGPARMARATGIGQVLPDVRNGGHDEELRGHIATFEQLTGLSASHVTVSFGNTGKGVFAYCGPTYTGELQIVVDSNRWHFYGQEFGAWFGEMIIMHELGHCVLERDHVEALNEYGQPMSVMHPNGVTNAYKENREYYIQELMGR
jgi:hypothetical protein